MAVRAIRIVETTIKQTIPLGPMNIPFYVVSMGVAGMALGSLAITAIGIAILLKLCTKIQLANKKEMY